MLALVLASVLATAEKPASIFTAAPFYVMPVAGDYLSSRAALARCPEGWECYETSSLGLEGQVALELGVGVGLSLLDSKVLDRIENKWMRWGAKAGLRGVWAYHFLKATRYNHGLFR